MNYDAQKKSTCPRSERIAQKSPRVQHALSLSLSTMDDPVWVGTGPPPDLHHECEVVLPLAAYDANLGMRTRGELRRQLRLDLPRSVVLLDGVRTRDASRVMSRVSHPRLCTQAVLAPPVEWLARQGTHRARGAALVVARRGGGDRRGARGGRA